MISIGADDFISLLSIGALVLVILSGLTSSVLFFGLILGLDFRIVFFLVLLGFVSISLELSLFILLSLISSELISGAFSFLFS